MGAAWPSPVQRPVNAVDRQETFGSLNASISPLKSLIGTQAQNQRFLAELAFACGR